MNLAKQIKIATIAIAGMSIASTTLALILVGTVILSQAVSLLGLPREAVNAINGLGLDKYGVLFMIVIVYLVLGCFFDGISLLLMTLPITFPMVTAVGFDPVWFGVIVTILMEVGMITQPLCIELYYKR